MTNATKAASLAGLFCSLVAAALISVWSPATASADEQRACIPGSDGCDYNYLVIWDRVYGDSALDTMKEAVLHRGAGFVPRGGGVDDFDASSPEKPAPDCVVVCTSRGWWDALSASGLAGIEGAPVLLTEPDELSAQTRAIIEELSPSHAIVVGGEAAVSARVAAQLAELVGSDPERIWGEDAVGTSLAVLTSRSSWSSTAFVATSGTFQDALSAGPYAYARRCPVVLAGADGVLSVEAAAALGSGAFSEAVVLGGESAVPSSELARLGAAAPERVWGVDAVGTCAALLDWQAARGYRFWGGGVATVEDYYDALVASACCGRHGLGLALVEDYSSDGYEDGWAAVLALKRCQAPVARDTRCEGFVFGGEAALSRGVVLNLPFWPPSPPDWDVVYPAN